MLTDPTTPRFGLQLDWKAALQSIERSKMFEALGKKPKLDQLYRFVRWSYSEGSPIFMRGPDGLLILAPRHRISPIEEFAKATR